MCCISLDFYHFLCLSPPDHEAPSPLHELFASYSFQAIPNQGLSKQALMYLRSEPPKYEVLSKQGSMYLRSEPPMTEDQTARDITTSEVKLSSSYSLS